MLYYRLTRLLLMQHIANVQFSLTLVHKLSWIWFLKTAMVCGLFAYTCTGENPTRKSLPRSKRSISDQFITPMLVQNTDVAWAVCNNAKCDDLSSFWRFYIMKTAKWQPDKKSALYIKCKLSTKKMQAFDKNNTSHQPKAASHRQKKKRHRTKRCKPSS